MKKKHKRQLLFGHSVPRFFRSWWLGVILMVSLILSIAVFHEVFHDNNDDGHTDSSAYSARSTKMTYGVALSDMLYEANNDKRAEVLSKLKDAGFTEVRLSISWRRVESNEGRYDWSHLDGMMKAVEKSGLSSILLADSTPLWARQEVCSESAFCPPERAENYADFLAAAASRYKTYNIVAWEIWNEQNGNNFWKPQPNPDDYAKLLKTSYKAIKRSNPQAVVLIGGLSGDSVDSVGPNLIDPRTYLKKLYAAGVHGYFDGLAYHPYFGVNMPTKEKNDHNGWLKMAYGPDSMRAIMTKQGDGNKNIWITELGVPTGGSGATVDDVNSIPPKADHASLEAQSQIVAAVTNELKRYPWVHSLVWYTYKDDVLAKTYDGAAYGIWKQDGTPKPMLRVLQEAMKNQ